LAKNAIGFGRESRAGEDTEAIEKMFSPEFRNRLDAIISFAPLAMEMVEKVVDKFIMELEAQLAERHVVIELSDEARRWLAEKGYDSKMGARPLSRVIQEHIKKPLAEELLFGKLVHGGTVDVQLEDDKLVFDIAAKPGGKSKVEEAEPELV
jgi:ATP-dependent Clp protease ATP-binding subunit ClpA